MSLLSVFRSSTPAGPSRRNWLKTLGGLLTGGWALGRSQPAAASPAQVQGADGYIGEILLVAFAKVPNNWLPCNGQVLAIQQYQALFSLLGTQYGGNGSNTFALPDLRGRVPVCYGQGAGLQNYAPGMLGGEETHALRSSELPAHTHPVPASPALGTTPLAADAAGRAYLADSGSGVPHYATTATTQLAALPAAAGGGQAHENQQPFLVVNFLICVNGIYPSRN